MEAAADERLSALLRQWQGVAPQADFEAAAWRRIRADRVEDQGRRRVVAPWHEWLALFPTWLNVAAAAAAGIVVGIGVGLSTSTTSGGHQTGEPLLHSQTLAGAYFAMATGPAP